MHKSTTTLKVLKKTAIAAAAALACSGAQAESILYSFGSQIDGPYSTSFQPGGTFASLLVTTTDSMHYVFDLYANSSFNTLFGSSTATIHRLVFNTNNVDPIASSVQLVNGTWGVDRVYYSAGNTELGGVTFDFMEGWGNGTNSPNTLLQSGERVVWETTFASPTGFLTPAFALKVFGFGENGNGQGWYVPNAVTPVPEPETYAMLLAGLGMLGFAARRRQKKEAAAA